MGEISRFERKKGYSYTIQRPGADHHATWYLTEENIAITLFNTNISLERRSELAKKIYLLQIPSEAVEIRKPTLPSITSKSILEDFVGGRSRVLFDLLGVSLEFLNEDNWSEAPEFSLIQAALKNLTPINDSSERTLGLATRFNTRITRTEASYQELMLVVESHCRKYSLKTKEDLKKLWMKIMLNQQLHWTKTMPNHQLLNPRSMEKSPKSLLVHLHSKDHQRPCSHLLQQKYYNLYPQLMICRVSLQSMKYSLVLQLQLITHLLQAE